MGVGGVRRPGGLLDGQGEVQDDTRADREPFGEWLGLPVPRRRLSPYILCT
jgi:hypothetical protein